MTDPGQMTPDQALSALLDDVARRMAVQIRTHVPGTILSVSRSTGRAEASVRVDMKARLRSGQTVSVGRVDRCPILWPAGGGWCNDADLNPGDEVLVIAFDRDISEWLDDGGEADPLTGNLHSLSSAAVVPVALRSRAKVGKADPGFGAYLIGREDGADPWIRLKTVPVPSVVIEAPQILLGEGATLGVARLNDLIVADAAWITWFTAVSSALAGLGVPTPAPISTPLGKIAVASSIVKAK